MPKRVDLDAMIPREDFEVLDDSRTLDLMADFPLHHLNKNAPVLTLLRKPDFQRETNHWSPEQVVTFIESFVDGEVIPSLILWKAASVIFVIDGGHRLSALRAWMEDDYGDKHISKEFFNDGISKRQREMADLTRALIKNRVGSYSDLMNMVGKGISRDHLRADAASTRALKLQWVPGNAQAAETSFYKINSQGTPLDETETMLIKNRHNPIAISARAIVRAGTGHKYWSDFTTEQIETIERTTAQLYTDVFSPEQEERAKTLELPLGGSSSPVEALALLIEFLVFAGTRDSKVNTIQQYADKENAGEGTIAVLKNAQEVLNRMSSKHSGSLGLHPAIYFYNERLKYSRYLFLAIAGVIHDKIRNNNHAWFKTFTQGRARIELFLRTNKGLLGQMIANLSQTQRVTRMTKLFEILVSDLAEPDSVFALEKAVQIMGFSGKILDVRQKTTTAGISEDTKAAVYLREVLKHLPPCPFCGGALDSNKAVTYHHQECVRNGGTGDMDNISMVHPYCNTLMA